MEDIEEFTKKIIAESKSYPELSNLNSTIDANSMQLYVDLDRLKARS